jgi:hypothetical protein
MSVFKNGKLYHYEFRLDGRRHWGSTGTAHKQKAIMEERRHRERLERRVIAKFSKKKPASNNGKRFSKHQMNSLRITEPSTSRPPKRNTLSGM